MLTRCAWCDEAERALASVEGEDLPSTRADVKAGASHLWRIEGGGWLVTRIDHFRDGTAEFVLVSVKGGDMGSLIPWLKGQLSGSCIDSLRFHSDRPGAERFTRQWGFEAAETVFKCKVR